MTDVVVTLPKWFGLKRWIGEGDPAGVPASGTEWGWFLGGSPPVKCKPGDRVYVVFDLTLIGYSELVRIERTDQGFALVRRGGAVAVTIDQKIRGFQGCRYRWWERSIERPFPEWHRGILTELAAGDRHR